jgi:hypothetical protein
LIWRCARSAVETAKTLTFTHENKDAKRRVRRELARFLLRSIFKLFL